MRPNVADPNGILNPNVRNNFVTTTGARTDPWDKWSIKGDQIFTNSNRVGFLFQKNRTQQLPVGDPPGLPGALNNTFQFGDTWTKVYRGTHDWNIGATVLNHLSVGFNDWGQVRRAGDPSYNQGWAPKLGIKNTAIPDLLFPQFAFEGGGGYSTWGRAEYGGSYNKTGGFSDDINWVKGAHTLKFGYQYQRDHYNGYGSHSASGSFTFNRTATSVPQDQTNTSGNAFASFLLGEVSSANLQTERFVSNQWQYHGIYAQDDWRASSNLTLSYGIRWEYTPPTVEGYGPDQYMNFNPSIPNAYAGGLLGAVEYAGFGEGRTGTRSLYKGWPWGFSPRLGIAYTLNRDTVIRLSGARTFGSVKNTGGSSHWQGFIGEYQFNSPNGNIDPAFRLDDGYPFWPAPPFLRPEGVNAGNPASNDTRFWQSYDAARLPEFYNWSLSIQRALPGNMVVDFGYNAQLGRHLVTNQVSINQIHPDVFNQWMNRLGGDPIAVQNLFNQRIDSQAAITNGFTKPYPNFPNNMTIRQSLRPFPQFNSINTADDGGDRSGSSNYHAFVFKWEKRYANGLTFLNSYVLSKVISDVGAANAGNVQGTVGSTQLTHYNRRLNKAVAGNDQTHNLKFSYSYELPFGKGKPFLSSGFGNIVLGGWRIAGIQQYASGFPLNLTTTYNPFSAIFAGNRVSVQRLDDWKNTNYAGNKFDPNKDQWWDTSRIEVTPTDTPRSTSSVYVARSTFGNAPVRNSQVRSPWFLNENVTLSRTLQFGEGVRLDIRGEAFNLLNRVRWGNPDSNINSQNFGRVTSQANSPRQVQLGIKLNF
jgi:hypothetical protein